MRPYDRLIGAALTGERWLFAQQQTVEAAWRVVDPVLGRVVPVQPYARGSWGPKDADRLLPDGPLLARPRRLSLMDDHIVPRRVVIVGGGFAGLFAARELRHRPVEVTVVDRAAHHLFQPLLYQCATGVLSEGQIAVPLRQLFKRYDNVDCLRGRGHRRRRGGPRGAGGAAVRGHDPAPVRRPHRRRRRPAVVLRPRRVRAARARDEDARRCAGDPPARLRRLRDGADRDRSGRAPALAHLRAGRRRADRRRARRPDPGAGHPDPPRRVPPARPGGGQGAALRRRQRCRWPRSGRSSRPRRRRRWPGWASRCTCTRWSPTSTRTASWCGTRTASPPGTRPATSCGPPASRRPPLAGMLAKATGAEQDRAGRILVQPDLTIPGHPEISVVGDLMSLDKLPGRGRGRDAVGLLRRQADPAAGRRRRGSREAGCALPLPRLRLGRLPLPRARGDLGGAVPGQRPDRLVRLARDPHRVPDDLPQPVRGDPDLGAGLQPGVPTGARLLDAADRRRRDVYQASTLGRGIRPDPAAPPAGTAPTAGETPPDAGERPVRADGAP